LTLSIQDTMTVANIEARAALPIRAALGTLGILFCGAGVYEILTRWMKAKNAVIRDQIGFYVFKGYSVVPTNLMGPGQFAYVDRRQGLDELKRMKEPLAFGYSTSVEKPND